MNAANEVWNRAAMEFGGEKPQPGDSALAALLLLHGLAMNGGIHHAIERLSSEELSAVIAGFAYFGLDEMVQWLSKAPDDPLLKEWTEDTEALVIFRYAELIPDNEFLSSHFKTTYLEMPTEFAPVRSGKS